MRICMASDFFYPNTGGVEAHIWHLSRQLQELGHRVLVITHAYGDRRGVRYLSNGNHNLKVYYLPLALYGKQNIKWPLLFPTFPAIRRILIQEQIQLVHGHSAFSPLAHEVMFHAKTLGLNTVFTDHSLFGQNDLGAIIHRHLVKLCLLQANHVICVSRVGKENKALQLQVAPLKWLPTCVIPNAVDTRMFTPNPARRDPSRITFIVNSRLVYRKGIDLLAQVLPQICQLRPDIHFIVAGDGPKRALLETAIHQHQLHHRVLLLGSVPHDRVRDVLVQGDIFLNTSLIEAFCMAVVEAASCGLHVVSTDVGGLPQVLPSQLVTLTKPTADDLMRGVRQVLGDLKEGRFVEPHEAHKTIEKYYSWRDVARKTEQVYDTVQREPAQSFSHRARLYWKYGGNFRFMFIFLIFINQLLHLIYHLFSRPATQSYQPDKRNPTTVDLPRSPRRASQSQITQPSDTCDTSKPPTILNGHKRKQ